MSAIEEPQHASGSHVPTFPIGSVDARMIGVMRCLLSLPVLALIFLTPGEPRRVAALIVALGLYFLWSLGALIWASRGSQLRPPRYEHWVDVLFAGSMVALTQGASSVFFFIFLFAILIASFSRGFSEGLAVTVASVLLLALADVWLAATATRLQLDRVLVGPLYLLALGYLMSFWGGHEITQRRRLRLLQEINNQWNPRFGHDHAVGTNLQRALEFFSARDCVLVLERPTSPPIFLTYHTSKRKRGQATLRNAINPETAAILLDFPANFSARYEQSPRWWLRRFDGAYQPAGNAAATAQCKVLANLLDTRSFLTVPYAQRDGTQGRVYLTAGKRSFVSSDVDFFAQLMLTISNVVEGMQLMDELVSRAAEHERYRISLDIHDTTVQPYIGLKLGLDALAREAGGADPLSARIAELQGMTESTIRDLRRYMSTLQDDVTLAGDSLVSAVREQVGHYQRFYGITVDVRCDSDIQVSSQLAGALLQIVAEGLSNILRHTTAKHAYLAMHSEGNRFVMEIANEAISGSEHEPDFIPRSIDARTRSLGGTSVVERDRLGYTIVRLVIPL